MGWEVRIVIKNTTRNEAISDGLFPTETLPSEFRHISDGSPSELVPNRGQLTHFFFRHISDDTPSETLGAKWNKKAAKNFRQKTVGNKSEKFFRRGSVGCFRRPSVGTTPTEKIH